MGADLALARLGGVGLGVGGAGGERRLDRALSAALDQTSVPPTVIAAIRTWPWPVPTGALWPPLPQMPVFIAKSLPTASIAASACRQLPIRVAPRHGLRHPAALDQVALGDAEDEVAGRRVDLAAAEGVRVEALLDLADDRLRLGVAGGDVGVGHARDRQVAEALAAAVAGRGDAVALGPQAVVEEGDQPAVLEHQGLLGRRALVVDRVAAPLVRHAAVVVGAEQRLGDLLAELARVDARPLLDVVGLEPVPGHLVEEDAAEAAADDDRHRARRRRAGVEQGQRLAGGLGGDRARVVFEQLEAAMAAERLVPGLDRVAAAGDRLDADPGAGAIVAGEEPLGVGDRDLAPRLAVGGEHLRRPRRPRRGRARRARAGAPPCARPAPPPGGCSIGCGVVSTACSARGSARSPRSAEAASAAARSRSAGSRPSTWAK